MPEGTEHLDYERLVELMVVHHEVEANIVKGLLEAGGIGCVLVTPVPHSLYPFTVDGLAEVTVSVLDTDLERARSIIADYESTKDQEPPEPDPDE